MDKTAIQRNIFGGITAGIVALPLALAFGVQSGLGAEAGLYGAIILGFIAAAFGGTQTQISGPTGPITVLTAAFIASTIKSHGSLEAALPTIFFTFCLAGLFQLCFGFAKLGKYIRYMPTPVVSGFMTGIGLIIIFFQLYPSMGLNSPGNINDVFVNLLDALAKLNPEAVALCIGTVALIYLLPKITTLLPSSLIALLIMTTISTYFNMQVPIIGHIPRGLPALRTEILDAFHIGLIYHAIWPALTIAVVGIVDSLLTSIVADNKTHTNHDSDQEVIGQGLGNFFTGLFGGLPGAGATMRTVVNINSGANHRLSGIVHSLLLFAILMGLGKYAELIPLSVLAGILLTVGISIIDYKGLKQLLAVPRMDALITLLVIVLTVFVGLLEAVLIGFIVASIATIHKVSEWSRRKSNIISAYDLTKRNDNLSRKEAHDSFYHNIYIKQLEGPLFFGFTSYFKELTRSIPNIDIVIIRMRRVPYMDLSGLHAIEEVYEYLSRKGIQVYFTGLTEQPKKLLHDTEVVPNLIPPSQIYNKFKELMDKLEKAHLA